MDRCYEHTQVGYLAIALLSGVIVILAVLMALGGMNWVGLIVATGDGVCIPLFGSLKVEIGDEDLVIGFGIGVISKRLKLSEIEGCRTVKTPWYYGWGIRITPNGWLYNVSSLDAVEVRMRTAAVYRIGTDRPKQLASAIRMSVSG